MSLIFGIGKGLFSLGIIWIVGLTLCLLLARLGKKGGVFGIVLLLVLFPLIMILYPREEKVEVPAPSSSEDVDTFYLPRVFYACFICSFALLAMIGFFLDHVLMPNLSNAAKTKKTYVF